MRWLSSEKSTYTAQSWMMTWRATHLISCVIQKLLRSISSFSMFPFTYRDYHALLTRQYSSNRGVGEGVFTMGVTGFTFVPLQSLSPRANEIHQAAEEQISKNSQNYPPGRLDQYKVQLERLARQAPSCELIAFPGCMSHPSMSSRLACDRIHFRAYLYQIPQHRIKNI